MAKTKSGELQDDPSVERMSAVYRAEKREDTRSRIALYYVLGFLFSILICFVIAGFQKLTVSDTRDLIVSVSSVLSGPLGFIIGFYFKTSNNEKE